MADYLEGHLALTDRALFDAHLDACSECSNEISEMRATIAMLRELPEPRVPGDFTANVMRRIRAGEATPTLFDRLGRFFESITSPGVLAPVSAALLSAGFVLWSQQAGLLDVVSPGSDAQTLQAEAARSQVVADATAARQQERLARAQAAESRMERASRADEGARLASNTGAVLLPSSAVDTRSQDSFALAPSYHVVISLQGAQLPYGIGPTHPAPVQIPLRADWGTSSAPRSLAVSATTPASGRSDIGPRTASMRVPSSAAPGSFGGASEPRSRDDWLEILEASPNEFAQRLSQLTLAEQELWIDRLARHAAEQGSLERVVERLRTAGGEQGRLLADDFSAVGSSAPN